MKRITAIVIFLMMLITLIPMTAHAETYTDSCGENATWVLDSETGVFTVSGTGSMNDYDWYGFEKMGKFPNWQHLRDSIRKVVIEDGITSVGDNAFAKCVNLTEVVLPDDLEVLGSNAFAECTSLTKIDIPSGLNEMRNSVFYGCASLKKGVVPGGLEVVGALLYMNCDSLESIEIGEGVTELDGAFKNCVNLKSVVLPSSIETIKRFTFQNCGSLASVTMPDKFVKVEEMAFDGTRWLDDQPDGLVYTAGTAYLFKGETPETVDVSDGTRYIASRCFSNCAALKKVTIPASVDDISPYAFEKCSALEDIDVDNENKNYVSVDGIVYSKDMKTLVRFPSGKKCNNIDLPDTVKTISRGAFRESAIRFISVTGKNLNLFEGDALADCDSVMIYFNCRFPEYYANADELVIEANSEGREINGVMYFTPSVTRYYSVFPDPGDLDYDRWKDSLGIIFLSPYHFRDAQGEQWFSKAAAYCGYLEYMTGTEDHIFSPDMTLSRAQMVQILAKVAGADLDAIEPSGGFEDVSEDAWFAKAVQWAVDNGITKGTGDGKFSPDAPVTREQLAVFLKAMAEKLGLDTSDSADIDVYADKGDISEWALDAVKWAVGKGLISGTSGTTISPKLTATRAQTALIIMMFNR